MPRRIQIKEDTDTSYYTVPVNPFSYDPVDDTEVTITRTVDGYSTETRPQFDGRVRTFSWNNLPNRIPFSTMVSTLKTYAGRDCNLKLRDLSGSESDETVTNIRVIKVTATWAPGRGPSDATSKMKYGIVSLEYVLR